MPISLYRPHQKKRGVCRFLLQYWCQKRTWKNNPPVQAHIERALASLLVPLQDERARKTPRSSGHLPLCVRFR